MIAEVKAAIEADRRVKLKSLAKDFMVNYGTMQTIVTDDLKMVKKSARWVPRLLNDDQKQTWVRCSQQFKELPAILAFWSGLSPWTRPCCLSTPPRGNLRAVSGSQKVLRLR